MGTTSDGSPADNDTLSYTFSPQISDSARQNRALLIEIMSRQGFVNYPTEWWQGCCRPRSGWLLPDERHEHFRPLHICPLLLGELFEHEYFFTPRGTSEISSDHD